MEIRKASFDSYLLLFLLFFVIIVLSIPTIAYLQEIQLSKGDVRAPQVGQLEEQPAVVARYQEESAKADQEKIKSPELAQDEQIVRTLVPEEAMNQLKQAQNQDPFLIIQEQIQSLQEQGDFVE